MTRPKIMPVDCTGCGAILQTTLNSLDLELFSAIV